MSAQSEKVTFIGAQGDKLAARLEKPPFGQIRAYAVFAHCFTCTKDIHAASRIAQNLARQGIAVLRFDFSGLGQSEGDFANTNFSSNVGDLLAACDFLAKEYQAPQLMVGHSLGGAAVIAASAQVPSLKAVATVAAPSDPAHVSHHFDEHIAEINEKGSAEVKLAGRPFTVQKQFIEDIQSQKLMEILPKLGKALMVMHSPTDETVSIDHARAIYEAAKHPKNFVSIDGADHLLRGGADAQYVADMLSAWATRYIDPMAEESPAEGDTVLIREAHTGKFLQEAWAGEHQFVVDEPLSYGGDNLGPTPYGYLLGSLGACTGMTLRMYARHKNMPLDHVEVRVEHDRVHASDCEDCSGDHAPDAQIEVLRRVISVRGDLTEEDKASLLRIADKCPVHKTIESHPEIITKIEIE